MTNQNIIPKDDDKKEKSNISGTMFVGMAGLMLLFGFLLGEAFFNDVTRVQELEQVIQTQKEKNKTLQELSRKEREAVHSCEKVLMGEFHKLKSLKKRVLQ